MLLQEQLKSKRDSRRDKDIPFILFITELSPGSTTRRKKQKNLFLLFPYISFLARSFINFFLEYRDFLCKALVLFAQ